jgi:predicted GIY-YIG superfamily endonuclease
MSVKDDNPFEPKSFLRSLTHRPGVYQMLNAKRKVIYVGKALDLRKRVSSYFQRTHADAKTASMMKLVADVEVTVTNTEAEALILEYNLIKRHKPRFNVTLFRALPQHQGRAQDTKRTPKTVPCPAMPGQLFQQPDTTLPAVSDQALHRAVRRLHRSGYVRGRY